MRRFRNILVVFDRASGNLAALTRAGILAVENGAHLSVAVCLSEFEDVDVPDTLRQAILEGVQGRFADLVEPYRQHGVGIDVQVLTGRPFIQVIRAVLRNGHDLVMKTAEGGLNPNHPFGGTDLHLLRKCPCAVWILDDRTAGSGPVLAAIAPHEPETIQERLNVKIIELATALAKQSAMPTHAVQVWTPPDDGLLRQLRTETMSGSLAARLADARSKLESRFISFVEGFRPGVPPVHAHFLDGIPEQAIARLCDEKAPAVIVMGTVTSTSTPGLFIGRTAETVLRLAPCSVLAVKPEGFVSPVAA